MAGVEEAEAVVEAMDAAKGTREPPWEKAAGQYQHARGGRRLYAELQAKTREEFTSYSWIIFAGGGFGWKGTRWLCMSLVRVSPSGTSRNARDAPEMKHYEGTAPKQVRCDEAAWMREKGGRVLLSFRVGERRGFTTAYQALARH